MNYKCHATSIIDEGAQIGDNSSIWHWSHICSKSKILKGQVNKTVLSSRICSKIKSNE